MPSSVCKWSCCAGELHAGPAAVALQVTGCGHVQAQMPSLAC